jgi:simple sugar transport system permease protein
MTKPRAARSGGFLDRLIGRTGPTGWAAVAAPVLAVALAALITSVVLLVTGNTPVATLRSMLDYGSQPRTIVITVNNATTYYISALAVAIGFRMNLFNIGVEGQYRLAALAAAGVGGAVVLPAPLHIALILVVAVAVGALWASVAAVLRAARGVSEVISTIMLNAIATGLGGWLLDRIAVPVTGSNNLGTRPLPPSGRVPGIGLVPGTPVKVFGFIVVAVLLGIGYHVLLNRTRFGFGLRATGMSEPAAAAGGVDVRRMIIVAMVVSGAVAGLVGMPQLLGEYYAYGNIFQAGLGFTGIAIALIGRNNPIGIAFGALLWGFLDSSSQILDLNDIPKEIVLIMQGTIVLSVIVAYELVHRYRLAAEQRRVGRQLSAAAAEAEKGAAA